MWHHEICFHFEYHADSSMLLPHVLKMTLTSRSFLSVRETRRASSSSRAPGGRRTPSRSAFVLMWRLWTGECVCVLRRHVFPLPATHLLFLILIRLKKGVFIITLNQFYYRLCFTCLVDEYLIFFFGRYIPVFRKWMAVASDVFIFIKMLRSCHHTQLLFCHQVSAEWLSWFI